MTTATAKPRAGLLSRFGHFAGIQKAKGEDVPSSEQHEEVKEDMEQVKDDVQDLTERVEDLEDEADDMDEPGVDKPAEQAAYRKGRMKGRKLERTRAGAILGLKTAAFNPVLAMHLAFETNATPKAALSTLQAAQAGAPALAPTKAPAPAPVAGSKLDGRMEGKTITVGAHGGTGQPDLSTPEGASAFAIAAANKARGIVPKKEG